jgi:hypothetical protein
MLATRGGDLAMVVGREDDCLAALGEAVEIDPDDFRSRLTMSFVLLRLGRYAEAWPHYSLAMTDEARDSWLWDGSEPLAGKSIAVRYDRELGLGDWIFGARYVRPLAEIAERVVLEVPAKLKSLRSTGPMSFTRASQRPRRITKSRRYSFRLPFSGSDTTAAPEASLPFRLPLGLRWRRSRRARTSWLIRRV